MGAVTVGAMYETLPPGYTVVYVEGVPYYYYGGNYYQPAGTQYKVVEAPAGAMVRYIPSGATKVVIDGVTYYQIDSTWYKRYFDENGEVSYMVVDDPT